MGVRDVELRHLDIVNQLAILPYRKKLQKRTIAYWWSQVKDRGWHPPEELKQYILFMKTVETEEKTMKGMYK